MLALSAILVFLTVFLAAGLAVLIGWFTLQRMEPQQRPKTYPTIFSTKAPNCSRTTR